MAVTKKKLSSYIPPKTVDELKGNPDVFIPVVEKNKNNYVLPLDDLLNKAEDGNIFIATYNVTTLAEIETAINAGKGVMLKVSNTKFVPMSSHVADGSATFTSISTEGNMLTAGIKHYFVTSAGWNVSPEYYNANKEIHIPSCITANVITALADTSSTWATIGNIIIGGHGTQGGGIDIMVKHIYSRGTIPVQIHTVFRTNATSGGEDNASTFSELTLSTSWTRLFAIGQYSGTSTVQCQLEADIWYTQVNPPTHYKISIYKYFDGTNTRLLISARECWGDSD